MDSHRSRIRDEWPNHLGLLISAAVFSLVVLRLYYFVGFDATTARAVLQLGGMANVTLGSAVASFPLIVTIVYSYGVMRVFPLLLQRRGPERAAILMAASTPALLAIAVVPLVNIGIPFVLLGGYLLLQRKLAGRPSRPAKPEDAPSPAERNAVLAFLVMGAVLTLSASPWLPQERFQPPDSKPLTGYAVGERGDEVAILVPGEGITFISKEGVRREFCASDSSWAAKSLPGLLAQDDKYVECDD